MKECFNLWKDIFNETLLKEVEEKEEREENLKANKEEARTKHGAILLAVCRGNFDEGIKII